MKKYFLGLASNFTGKAIFRHTFATGSAKDSEKLRTQLASMFKVNKSHVALTKNGRSALAIAIQALVPKKSKVLINGFTCQAVVEAVLAASCTPIYADIDTATLHYNAKTLAKLHQQHPNLRAVIIQNTLGIPADPAIYAYAAKHRLIIIEDMAHYLGTELKGYAACLSFGKGKVIDTISGGAVILKNRNVKQPTGHPRFADNFRARFYPLFGRIARAFTPTIFAKLWLGGLLKLHLIERSADSKLDTNIRMAHWQAKLVSDRLNPRHVIHHTVPRKHFLVNDRPQLLRQLQARHYYFDEFWYDTPISPKRNYQKWHFPEKDCPNAVQISQSIVNIPTFYSERGLQPALDLIKEHQK